MIPCSYSYLKKTTLSNNICPPKKYFVILIMIITKTGFRGTEHSISVTFESEWLQIQREFGIICYYIIG